jgi:uncharacterized protein YcbK (DUF882 family)
MTNTDKRQVQKAQQANPMAETLTAAAAETAVQNTSVPGNEAENVSGAISLAGEAMNLLEEHKGKLSIGVAAALGLMVFYRWREKQMAKTDPEEYAQLQRLKVIVRHSDDHAQPKAARKAAGFYADKKGTTAVDD